MRLEEINKLIEECNDAINEHNLRKKPYEALSYKVYKLLLEELKSLYEAQKD